MVNDIEATVVIGWLAERSTRPLLQLEPEFQ